MTPPQFLSVCEKLDLVLDVLRANRLHQQACAHRGAVEENSQGMWHVEVPPCDCWLSEPPAPPAVNERDLRVDVDARAVTWRPGMSEDEWPAVKITHLPTGHTVTRRGRSQIQAKAEALHALAELVHRASLSA